MPNLGVNKDDPTCATVDALLSTAQSDKSRLGVFVKTDLTNAINNIQSTPSVITLVQSVCNIQLRTQTLSLLQAQASSNAKFRTNSRSEAVSALKKASAKLNSNEDHSQLYNDVIGGKVDEITDTLLELTKDGASQSSSNFKAICADVIPRIQKILDYLNFIKTQINNQVLGIDIPNRITTLTNFKTACQATPVTQTGSYRTTYYETGNFMQQGNRPDTRVDDVPITFPQAFSAVPTVGLAIYGHDINSGTPRVQVDAIGITKTGFTLRITASPYTILYNVYVNYIATLSDKSGIYIINDSIDARTDSAVKRQIQGGTSGYRSYTRIINTPVTLPNAKSAVFLRGFDFSLGLNLRMDLASDSQTVTYRTWDESILNAVSVTILYWSGNDNSVVLMQPTSTYGNQLTNYGSPGERTEQKTFSTNNYIAPPEKFYGLTHIDYDSRYNYRLDQPMSGSNSLWTYTFRTWWDTRVFSVNNNLIFTCTLQDKTRCVKSS